MLYRSHLGERKRWAMSACDEQSTVGMKTTPRCRTCFTSVPEPTPDRRSTKSRTSFAVTPIVGTPRTAAAAAKIVEALGLAIDMAESAQTA